MTFNGSFQWAKIVASSIASSKRQGGELKQIESLNFYWSLVLLLNQVSNKVIKFKTEDSKLYTSRKHHQEEDKQNWKNFF